MSTSGEHPTPGTMSRIAALFRPYRARLAVVALVVVATAGLGVVTSLLIKQVFDNALFCPRGCPNLPLLGLLTGGMTAILVVTSVLGVGQTYLASMLGHRVMQDLRNALYAHLQRMPLRFFTETKIGDIQSRLANDVGGVQTVVTETAASILANIVTLVSAVVAMFVLSWPLTVLSLALLPVFVWLTIRVGKVRHAVSSSTQQTMAELSTLTEETLSISGILLSKSFGRQSEEITRFRERNARLADLQLRHQMIGRSLIAVVGTFFSVAPVLVYLAAGLFWTSGGLTAGTLVAFTTLQSRLFFPIGTLLETSTLVQSSFALFERIFEYLDLSHDIIDGPDATRLVPDQTRGAVSLRNVSFRYPTADGTASRRWALQDLTLDIAPGQLAAVVGSSGSGKTTLSYLLPRFYDVTSGAVLIDGRDVRGLHLDSLARTIGMVTQETYLFHASIRENLRYGNPDATDAQIEAAARAAAIHDRIRELDDGYDTLVGERGYRMSGGEKQRLAIARVILKDPKILILDEATSALDTVSEQLVQQALTPLMAGRTTVAIAHRLSTILAADVIFVLDRGRLVEQGTHEELLDRGGTYARLYRQQFGAGAELRSGEVARACPDPPGASDPVRFTAESLLNAGREPRMSTDAAQPALLLSGATVALGVLRRDLVPTYHRWRQDLTVLAGLGQRFPETLELSYQSYENASNAREHEAHFTVYDVRDHDAAPYPIGTTCLQGAGRDNAYFTIVLGERRGQGLGTEATRLTLDWAFNVVGLRNVELGVSASNEAAIRAYTRAGFKEIGRRRNAGRWLGKPCDLILMDAVPEDFVGSVVAASTEASTLGVPLASASS